MIIRNGEVFQEDGTFCVKDVYIENNKIVEDESLVTDKTVVDASGLKVIPGLVDVHSHGAAGFDFCDADVEGLKKSWNMRKKRRYLLLPNFYDSSAGTVERDFCNNKRSWRF